MRDFSKFQQGMCVAFAAISLASCDLLGPSAQDLAVDAFEQQDYLAARSHAATALAQDAQNAEALIVLLHTQLAMGEGAEALTSLAQLDDLEALPEDHLLLEAEARLQLGEVSQASALLDGVNSAESWRLRALAATLDNDDKRAMQAFSQGRAADGDKARLYAAEATYHLRRGSLDTAREAVGLAQQTAPRRVETQFVTAWLAQLEENHEIAARAFMAILDKTPQDRPAMLGAIDALQNLDRDDLADPLISQGRNHYSGDLAFIYFAARAHGRKGDWVAARDLLQEHEAQLAGQDPAQMLYAQSLLQLGQGELARAIVTPIHSRRSSDPQVVELYDQILAVTRN